MNNSVDNYFINGCERCSLGGTQDCKVHIWKAELKLLREIANSSGLKEECKWGVPCYTYQNSNVLMISAFKDYCAISFFKGTLIDDPKNILVKQGENSQAARLIKCTNVDKIKHIKPEITNLINKAIEVEKSGQKVNFIQNPEPIPEELEIIFSEDPSFKSAFEALTPGRQRGYIIYFSAPKQSKTRITRIEKNIANILNGVGLHDKYANKK